MGGESGENDPGGQRNELRHGNADGVPSDAPPSRVGPGDGNKLASIVDPVISEIVAATIDALMGSFY